jgi:drug/metabolite transporter (DMT)-like permease
MDLYVFLAVLAAAACHASWNALLKLNLEPIVAISLVSMGCGIVALPLLPFTGVPAEASWPYIAASLTLHLGYYIALGEAYRTGDLGQVYPIARGTAPLMTAVATTALLGEQLGQIGWFGVLVLAVGLLLLSLKGGRTVKSFDPRSVSYALLTATTISAYTLVDGVGARIAGSPHAYAAWLMLFDGLMMAAFGLWRFPAALTAGARKDWTLIIAGGALSAASYWTAIWAMTVAPIALVAALRETSVLVAAVIGVVFLREPLLPARIAAACLVVAGIMLIRLR